MVPRLSSPTARRRLLAVALTLSTVHTAAATSFGQAPTAADAKTAAQRVALADKAAAAKKWDEAAQLYQEAKGFQATAQAQAGLANARYQLGQAAEAYTAYQDLLASWGPKLSAGQKAEAE